MLTPARAETAAARRLEPSARARAAPVELWAVLAITLIGAALRFATIAAQSYWYDEATTVNELHMSFGGMLHAVAHSESTPPLYYVLAWIWAKVLGTGEAALRSLSALAGTAAIPVAYLCARDLASRTAGVLAAALTALSPFLIWYSQEARSYMLFALCCGLSFLFFLRARRDPSTRNLAGWAICSALAVLSHFFAGFVVAPEAIWLLVALRSRAAVAAVAVVAAVQAALIPLLIGDLGHPLLGWITQFPLSIRAKQVPIVFGFGTLYQSPLVNQGLVGGVVFVVVIAALVWFGAAGGGRRAAGAAALVAASTIIVPLLVAEAGHDYYVARNLIGGWIPLAVLVALACTAHRTLPAGAALAALLLGAFVFAQVKIESDPQYQRSDWQGVAAALGPPVAPRVIVANDGSFATVPLTLYLAHASRVGTAGALVFRELDVVGSTWQTLGRLPAGVRLIARRSVNQYLVVRFLIPTSQRLPPPDVVARVGNLLAPARSGAELLVQRPAK